MKPRTLKTIWAVTCLYVLILAAGSLMPDDLGHKSGWDRIMTPTLQNALHVPAYAVLQVLLSICVWRSWGGGMRRAGVVAIGCCAYGALLEYGQTLVPGRFGGGTDMISNAAGAAVGLLVVALLHRRLTARPSPSVAVAPPRARQESA